MRRGIAGLLCLLLTGCSWAWTQLSGGSGTRCRLPELPFEELVHEAALRARVTVMNEAESQELTLVIEKSMERLAVVGISAFGAKQFERIRTPEETRVTIYLGGLLVHPEALSKTVESVYLRETESAPDRDLPLAAEAAELALHVLRIACRSFVCRLAGT